MSRGRLSEAQITELLRALEDWRVRNRDGNDYLEQHDVRARLTMIFGFGGWEKQILELSCVAEHQGNPLKEDKTQWYVTYRCLLRLRVFDEGGGLVLETDDVGTGAAQNQPGHGDAHDQAAKSAVSAALKRCAIDLGDQFGLALYEDGPKGRWQNPIVAGTVPTGWSGGGVVELASDGAREAVLGEIDGLHADGKSALAAWMKQEGISLRRAGVSAAQLAAVKAKVVELGQGRPFEGDGS